MSRKKISGTVLTQDKEQMMVKLSQLLETEPLLAAKLLEALESGVTFITITYQKGSPPNDMQHFWYQKGFPAWSDIVKWLKHIANDWKAKKFPTADLDNDGDWH